MKAHIAKFTVLFVSYIFLGSNLFASTLSIKKDGVELLSEPKKGANVVQTLKKDEELIAVERKGMYWQVKLPDNKTTGYVSVLSATHKPDQKEGISGLLNAAVKEGRAENEVNSTRTRSTVMGVRGLDDTSQTAFAGSVKPNMKLVYAMEDFAVADDRLAKHTEAIMKEIENKIEE
ncbi:MAG: hypothetical protein KBD78_08000 [Oligoflexales bacterium]|nr:hypothetical protein [Oligoflexales bacterium]